MHGWNPLELIAKYKTTLTWAQQNSRDIAELYMKETVFWGNPANPGMEHNNQQLTLEQQRLAGCLFQ